jgi:hypothetical protein
MLNKIIEDKGGFRRIAWLLPIILCSMILSSRADESKHRIMGLFEPDRQEDLRECVKTMPEVQLANLDYETAEVTFRYDVAKLINGYNPKKPPTAEAIAKRLDELLRAASNGTFTIAASATLPKDKLETVAIKVGILDCKGCRYGAYLAVAKIDGVERATITANAHTLTAQIDPAKTKRTALEDALKKAHFELAAP